MSGPGEEESQQPSMHLPFGLQQVKPGAVRNMTTEKLASFSLGASRKTPFQKHLEAKEAKRKQQEEEAAAELSQWVEQFEAPSGKPKFVRGGTMGGVREELRGEPPPRGEDRGRDDFGRDDRGREDFGRDERSHDDRSRGDRSYDDLSRQSSAPSRREPQGGGGSGASASRRSSMFDQFPTEDDVDGEELPGVGPSARKKEPKEPPPVSAAAPPVGGGSKKASQIASFMQELRREQEERESRGERDSFEARREREAQRGESAMAAAAADPETTNLYVGNLPPSVSEESLFSRFSAHGPIQSVKIMWPRTEEEHQRQRLCGFVAFVERADAAAAMNALNDTEYGGYIMRIGWGKKVSQPAPALTLAAFQGAGAASTAPGAAPGAAFGLGRMPTGAGVGAAIAAIGGACGTMATMAYLPPPPPLAPAQVFTAHLPVVSHAAGPPGLPPAPPMVLNSVGAGAGGGVGVGAGAGIAMGAVLGGGAPPPSVPIDAPAESTRAFIDRLALFVAEEGYAAEGH